MRPGLGGKASRALGLGFGLALLAAGLPCLLRAEAAPSRGHEVRLSPEELAITEGPGPVEVEAGPRAGSVKVSVPAVPGAKGYVVERAGWDEGPWEDAASGTAPVFVIGGLRPHTSYCFRFAARRANGGQSPFGVPGCGKSR